MAAGVAFVLAGVFVIDPGTYSPAGVSTERTWHGLLHDIVGPIAFAAIAAAVVVLLRRFTRWIGWTAAAAVVALWMAAGAVNGLDYAGVWSPAPAGLFQRLSILVGFGYLAWTAWRIRSEVAQRPEHAAGTGDAYASREPSSR
ncbi:putative membrane protein YphA (DoxX/SURF4 family) [Saccharomonospora amisosensis]|uniref:Putative membrane protein YphA (DoxX/SURF4 family) n=1 Tax=Saccharomonospora amisosensis TaxID=1128677 RepID=A0A7X5UST0_9PSEU|nr:putative membrane protein YphA (DoxX/SURF4 family) [Saccharomonospora amisosensis]